MNREAQMTRAESHPIGRVRNVAWSKVEHHLEAEPLIAPPFEYHHVPG
jgi:hypothetical protein